MSWIGKVEHSFNKYIGEKGTIVNSISKAKEFNTKDEASDYVSKNGPRTPIEILELKRK